MNSTFICQTINSYRAVTSIEQGRVVRIEEPVDGAPCCAQAQSPFEPIFGVAVNSAEIGGFVDVQFGGVCLSATMGSSAPAGSFLTSDYAGRLVPAQSGDRYVGVLLPYSILPSEGSSVEVSIIVGKLP